LVEEFSFESIEREYERYWRAFIAEQLEDVIAGSKRTQTPESEQEARWFREGLRFAVIICRYTESTDPTYADVEERLRRRPPDADGGFGVVDD
jgi:hypothetical protein